MTRVVAVESGHDGVQYRQVGDEFEVTAEQLSDGSTWFVPVEDAPAPKPKPANPRPPGAGPVKGSKAG